MSPNPTPIARRARAWLRYHWPDIFTPGREQAALVLREDDIARLIALTERRCWREAAKCAFTALEQRGDEASTAQEILMAAGRPHAAKQREAVQWYEAAQIVENALLTHTTPPKKERRG